MKKLRFGLVAAIFCFLAVTLPQKNSETYESPKTENKAEEIVKSIEKAVVKTAELADNEIKKAANEYNLDYDDSRKNISLNEEYIAKELTAQKGRYHFDYLKEDEKRLYTEIYAILTNRAEEVLVSATDPDKLELVFQCVLNDHPEIFYVSGYTYTKYTYLDEIRRITFSGTYTLSKEEIASRKPKMEAYVEEFLKQVPNEAGEYEKVKFVYDYLIYNTDYNLESADNQNICSVFLNRESVCQGYAKATQLLLERLGISSTLVIGTVESGEGHAWNLVKVDGAYYYVDTTWGDAFYVLGGSEYDYPDEKRPNINYDYLLVTTDQLTQTHVIDNIVPMPRCVATEANYYIREDAYFTSVDKEQIKNLFERAYQQQKDFVTLKCSDLSVYTAMEEALLTNQEVFSYLSNQDGMVAYSNNSRQWSISFWL